MITSKDKQLEDYEALVKNCLRWIFFAGIKTTGIFCHATCAARKPKLENCEFFETAEAGLLSEYRPCKICQPLSYPQAIPAEIKQLVHASKRTRKNVGKKVTSKALVYTLPLLDTSLKEFTRGHLFDMHVLDGWV